MRVVTPLANKRAAEAAAADKEDDLQKLCDQVLKKDPSIRFVGIASHLGRLTASAYRPGLAPLMTKDQTEQYAIEAVTRALTRETFEPKLGKLRYATGTYEKLIRATIPVSVGKDNRGFYLLISFDTGCDTAGIIEEKVLPFIIDE